jgi:hypothetical protein
VATDDLRCLLGFMVDCPQPNQVKLLYWPLCFAYDVKCISAISAVCISPHLTWPSMWVFSVNFVCFFFINNNKIHICRILLYRCDKLYGPF